MSNLILSGIKYLPSVCTVCNGYTVLIFCCTTLEDFFYCIYHFVLFLVFRLTGFALHDIILEGFITPIVNPCHQKFDEHNLCDTSLYN